MRRKTSPFRGGYKANTLNVAIHILAAGQVVSACGVGRAKHLIKVLTHYFLLKYKPLPTNIDYIYSIFLFVYLKSTYRNYKNNMRCLLATAGRLVAGKSLNVPTG